MGKKKNKSGSNLGRSLVKDRFAATSGKRIAGDSLLHTSEINDGYEWGRLNLQSVTEESSFQEFLSTAELAGTEFQAEKLNISFVTPTSGLLSKTERAKKEAEHEENKDLLRIPRRPSWNAGTTGEELKEQERTLFLKWRHDLAVLQEQRGFILTPYEKNLEFWRQLWRVVERSDVLVQILDARNPLLFRCEDLEQYVKEVDPKKSSMLLLNKADLLTERQREIWADYFNKKGINFAFFSAVLEADKDEDSDSDSDETIKEEEEEEEDSSDEESEPESLPKPPKEKDPSTKEKAEQEVKVAKKVVLNTSQLLSHQELIDLFKLFEVPKMCTCIGLVGYPNVGKSSTINALLQQKKVSVSTTPGKTKHFQTLYLDPSLMLCDCPGLVMPSFVSTKADMVINGILPVDQLRDHVPSVSLVTELIPRHVLEEKYGLMLPPPREGEDQDRVPTADELLSAYGFNRGFMTQRGLPDNSRSARCVLKDFVNGKLLFCHSPPDFDQSGEEFHPFPPRTKLQSDRPPPQLRVVRPHKMSTETLDKMFFNKASIGIHVKGQAPAPPAPSVAAGGSNAERLENKPWKRHNNKNKREKSRKVYAHLDQC